MRRSTSSGILALLGIGGFLIWRNRSQIQEFLQSKGIQLPVDMDTENLKSRVRSGVDRVRGKLEEGRSQLSDQTRKII
jgi:hypothetical protein